MKAREERIYTNRWGDLIYVLINPCGCHPNECTIWYSMKDGHSYGRGSKSALSRWLNQTFYRVDE